MTTATSSMRHTRARYALEQLAWILWEGVILVSSMGVGITWLFMSVRVIVYGMIIFPRMMAHFWWYGFSPTIIRRVAYRVADEDKQFVAEEAAKHHVGEHLGSPRRSSGLRGGSESADEQPASPSHLSAVSEVEPESDNSDLEGTIYDADASVLCLEELSNVDVLAAYESSDGETSAAPGTPNRDLARSFGRRRHLPRPRKKRTTPPTEAVTPTDQSSPATSRTKRQASKANRSLPTDTNHGYPVPMGPINDPKDPNHNNRAFLDIYMPVPVASLFERKAPSSRRHTRSNGGASPHNFLHEQRFPVAVCVSGGAWIIGSHMWSSLLARLLSARGYLVFVPDYRNFPQTSTEGMVEDVDDALCWIHANCERFRGDPANITVIGQSAGAHLTMMSMLRQAEAFAAHSTTAVKVPYPVARPRYRPREMIKHFVGLSGFYDLVTMQPYLHKKGLYSRVLNAIAGGADKLAEFSVTSRIAGWAEHYDEDGRAELRGHLPCSITLMHGNHDKSAPLSESERLKVAIDGITPLNSPRDPTRDSPPTLLLVLDRCNHTDPVVEEALCGFSSIADLLSLGRFFGMVGATEAPGAASTRHGDVARSTVKMTVPPTSMPWELRIARHVCPF